MTNSANQIISPEEVKNKVRSLAEGSEKNVCVILGAGASSGYSKEDDAYAPPIVADLFDSNNRLVREVLLRHTFIDGQKPHIVRTLQRFNGDLEAYLTDLYTKDVEDNTFPALLRYLEDIFHTASLRANLSDNNYQSLINIFRELRGKKPWSFLSFNYDTILELSLIATPRFIVQRDFASKDSYLRATPKILKMHGGVNYRYHIEELDEKRQRLSYHEVFTDMMDAKVPSDEYAQFIQPTSAIPNFSTRIGRQDGIVTIYDFPLMMIPIHGSVKPENSFFNDQIELAKKEISESKLVIAIGYNFGDELFRKVIGELDLKENELILVGTHHLVTKTTEHLSYKNAAMIWPPKNISIFGGNGFGKFIEALY